LNVAVVGGGPGGLYSALLIKKSHPGWDVAVLERNAADATYGWGVVFSDRTLTSFREADYRTYVEIVDRFVTWDAIDVRYRDQTVRCEGQGFSGIARKALLQLLQERCAEVGVQLRFETEVHDAASLSDADLVVAADGVHSLLRSSAEERFRPRYDNGLSRYIWFGVEHPFDSFTFIFRTNDHGTFQAHAYPFDGSMSTFIVETSEATWRRAGLDVASEVDNLTYCEKLFAPELHGRELLSNASKWMSFTTVRCRAWSDGNIALLGDAAHTAHFSIGSGTKLAMEDAIALANSLEVRSEMGAALADYELERRPRVERFQEAARQSQTLFEHTDRYMHLEPMQFAFHLLTRSGRVDYDSLRLGDRRFVATVDRWFAATDGDSHAIAPPPAFVAARIGPTALSNRIAVAARPTYSARDGVPGSASARGLLDAAGSGAGLVLTELASVSDHGRITPRCPGLYRAGHVDAWRVVLGDVRRKTGAAVALRLGHAGRRAATEPRDRGSDRPLGERAWQPVAPSPLPYTRKSAAPRTMGDHDLERVAAEFAEAAAMARDADADVLLLDMAHGYLLGSFLSPLTNRRTDRYGGDLPGRARWPLEVFDAVRSAWPPDRALGASLTAEDWARGGATIADAVAIARLLKARGCDFVDVRAGQTVAATRPIYDPYYLIHYSDRIRNEARISTLTTGAIVSVDDANTIVAAGRGDLCLLL
jgi:anthraniloyl-CoA monooxygenase